MGNEELDRLTDLVKIQYKDSAHSWNDFYYDDDRYHVLVNKLEKSQIDHPIALVVINS
jgi:hypothetical protein